MHRIWSWPCKTFIWHRLEATRSRVGKAQGPNVDSWVQCELFLPFVSTLLNILGTLQWTGIFFFFLMYNICSKFLKAPFYQKVSLPPGWCFVHRQITRCLHFPFFVIRLGPHKFHMCSRLLSPHMQHQIHRPTHFLPDQGHFPLAHPPSTKILPTLIYNKHMYFCSLSGALDPCIVLKRKFSFVQDKLYSTPAVTLICPSPSARPMVWFPTSFPTSSFGKVSTPCTASLLLFQQSFAARFP